MGWAIIGVCAAAILYLWWQYQKKEREFREYLEEIKRRGQSTEDETNDV